MNKKDEQQQDEIVKNIYRIVNKLEQRIFKLERVLESHAKCIGEMREKNEQL
jgi:exonuclease VII small subunit